MSAQLDSRSPIISLEEVTKAYLGKEPIFSNISMEIDRGEFVFLTGISGAGKSTIFRMLLGLECPDSGYVRFKEYNVNQLSLTDLNEHRRTIGMVFQDYKLLAKKTAAENIEIPLLIQGMSRNDRDKRLQSIAKKLSIQRLMGQRILSLSGGEQQLVAIARAAVHDPVVIFADEPTANLDQKTATRIVRHLLRLNEEGTTVIIATHDINLIKAHEKRILLIKNAQMREIA